MSSISYIYRYMGKRVRSTDYKPLFDGMKMSYSFKFSYDTQISTSTLLESHKFPFSYFRDSRGVEYYGRRDWDIEAHCNVIYLTDVFRLISIDGINATIRSHDGAEEFKVDKYKLVYAVQID